MIPRVTVFSLCLCAAALALTGCNGEQAQITAGDSAHNSVPVATNHPHLRYTGRWLQQPTPHVGWAGSQLQFAFSGESASVELEAQHATDRWRAVVNGVAGPTFNVELGRKRYVLAQQLDTQQVHNIALIKETNEGVTLLHSLAIAAGQLQPLPAAPAKTLMFFGDSNMDGTSLYSEKDRGDSGSYYAYPATTARMLGASFSVQAYGGATWQENGENNIESFLYAPLRNQPDRAYQDPVKPDVIVINAGANDIYKIKNRPLKAAITARITSVIAQIRRIYGDQPHIVLYNAYGWDLNEPANYTHEIVQALGGNLSALLYPWTWEQWHGSMIEHAGQARLLAQHILDLNLGFERQQEADVFDGFAHRWQPANGSFEFAGADNFNAFGWRYHEDGVQRLHGDAPDGHYFIRLAAGDKVHQGMDATGDFLPGPSDGSQTLEVSAQVRSQAGAELVLSADFEGQALYGRGQRVSHRLPAGAQWQQVTAQFTVPAGSWKIYLELAAADNGAGALDIDNIRVNPVH